MKMKLTFYILAGILVVGLQITSCKKNMQSNALLHPTVYIPQAIHNPNIINLPMSDTAQTIIYSANYSGINEATRDVRVSFEINPALVDSFNLKNKTDYSLMPVKAYTLQETNAVIPRGRRATVPLKLNIETIGYLTPSTKYLIPLTVITKQTGPVVVNKKLSTAYFVIQAQYDTTKIYMPQAKQNPVVTNIFYGNRHQVVAFSAKYEGASPMDDVKITFEANTSLTDGFNSAHGTQYPPLPEGSYELSQTTGIIRDGDKGTLPIHIEIKTKGFLDLNKGYILPVRITQVDGNLSVNKKLILGNSTVAYFLIYPRIRVFANFNYQNVERSRWTVTSDSYQSLSHSPSQAFDGDVNTFWHTEFSPVHRQLPHWILVNMNELKTLHGFYFYQRRGSNAPSKVKDIQVDVSLDGMHWNAMGDFVLKNSTNKQVIYLPYAVKTRYFRVTIGATYAKYYTYLAEVGAF